MELAIIFSALPPEVQYATLAAGAAIAMSVLYSVGSWVFRAPCPKCGGRKVRIVGARHGIDPPRRCFSCGWSND